MQRKLKSHIQSHLPARIRIALRNLWEDVRDWLGVFAFALGFAARRKPRPDTLLYFGFAPGDDLLCTAVLRELKNRGDARALMISNHRALFVGNDDVDDIRPLWRRYYPDRSTVSICRRFARLSGGTFLRPHYAPLAGNDRSTPPQRHIIAELCASVGIAGPVAIMPYFSLTDEERQNAAWARGHIVIQSSGMGAQQPIRNKQWPAQRFQGVVDALREDVDLVQLGSASDPALRHAQDLRGATSLRQSAAILANARLYVGTVGFLMHLARAVECPAVIVYGGREAPWQSGYVANLNLYTALPCAPCWRWNTCDFDRKCMSDISVDDVVSAIRQMLDRPREPLPIETVELPEHGTGQSTAGARSVWRARAN